MIRKLLLLAALAAGGFGAWTYWRVARAESGALSAAREAQSVPFLRSTVQTVGGFETVASPADYRDAAIWNQAL
ncbi:MAG: hypothetical protein FJW30_23350, partial [Acidobacteria bacterium]|nr:hypothetical protein [Acidobacteriota bacterium]